MVALIVPYSMSVGYNRHCGGGRQMLTADGDMKMMFAGGAALVVGTLGMLCVLCCMESPEKAGKALYQELTESIALARLASKAVTQAGAGARLRQPKDARRKCAREVSAAREKVQTSPAQVVEKHRTALAQETRNNQAQLAAIAQEKQRDLDEMKQKNDQMTQQIEQENSAATHDVQTKHDNTIKTIEMEYESQCQALATRWGDGLRAVTDLLAAGSGIDPRLVDWNSPAWEHWQAPREFSGQVRFGEMKVDLAQLTSHVPVRLQLPETFS